MAKDPAFLFYSSDFISGTYFLTDEQTGKYIRLLCMQHQKGHLSKDDMIKICKSYNKHIFSKFAQDETGNYYNERLETEISKRLRYSESRSLNRKRKKHMLTYDEHMENENSISIITNTEINANEIEFEKNLISDILKYFLFTESDLNRKPVSEFIYYLKIHSQLLHFYKDVWPYYKEYHLRPDKKEYRHDLFNFIDGKWNAKNWREELNKNHEPQKITVEKKKNYSEWVIKTMYKNYKGFDLTILDPEMEKAMNEFKKQNPIETWQQ